VYKWTSSTPLLVHTGFADDLSRFCT
jgi:hypothetical protein